MSVAEVALVRPAGGPSGGGAGGVKYMFVDCGDVRYDRPELAPVRCRQRQLISLWTCALAICDLPRARPQVR